MSCRVLWLALAGVPLFVGAGVHAQVRPPACPALVPLKDTSYPIPASGAYYVAPGGSSTNAGTVNSPWSVAKALSSTGATAGATIVFRGGTYRDIGPTNIARRLTLQAYPNEKPWIKGSKIIPAGEWSATNNAIGTIWVKTGWTYGFPNTSDPKDIDAATPSAGHRDMVFVNDQPKIQIVDNPATNADEGVTTLGPGEFYVDYAGDKLYVGDNPKNAGTVVEATAYNRAFGFKAADGVAARGTIIRGLGFAHYADRGLLLEVPDVTLENNTFAWNGLAGVGVYKGALNNRVVGNTFSCNGQQGLSGSWAHRLHVENNTFSHNNVERFKAGWSAGGIKIIHTENLVVRNNRVERNYGNGLWLDISCVGAIIVGNTARHNDGYGILVELSHDVIVAFNVCHNNNAGVSIWDSSGVRVYNNTLSKNRKNIHVTDTTRVNDNAKETVAGITWVSSNIVLKNNLLSNVNGTAGPLLDVTPGAWIPETSSSASMQIAACNRNGYHRTGSGTPAILVKWYHASPHTVGSFNTFAAFNSATGHEAGGLGLDGGAEHPFFVDEAGHDFRLKASSPAVNHGEALPHDIAKAAGKSPSPVHLGALGVAGTAL